MGFYPSLLHTSLACVRSFPFILRIKLSHFLSSHVIVIGQKNKHHINSHSEWAKIWNRKKYVQDANYLRHIQAHVYISKLNQNV